MKRYVLPAAFSVVIGSFIALSYGGRASAHVLKENNGVSAVLHIPPDDNPVAAQTTKLDFSFSSDRGNFSLADCDCQVKVQTNGQTIQTIPIVHLGNGDALEASAAVKFPVIGIYDVLVSGRSKTAVFKPFSLDYLERVATSAKAPAAAGNNNQATVLLLSSASFVLLAMVTYAVIENGGRYKQK